MFHKHTQHLRYTEHLAGSRIGQSSHANREDGKVSMPIFKPTSADIQLILLQLEQATYNHDRWYEALVATLVCRIPCDEHDVHEDAFRKCRFGQWLYGLGSTRGDFADYFSALR